MSATFATVPTAHSIRLRIQIKFDAVTLGLFNMPRLSIGSARKQRKFSDVANALGQMCIYWGRLEQGLGDFIELLAPLEIGDVSRSVTSQMDIRSKIQAIRGLVFLRKPSEEWLNKMVILLDYIDNDLRPRRNRYIHDAWYFPGYKIVRRSQHVKLLRPEAFKLELSTEVDTNVTVREVKKLVQEIDDLFVIQFAFWFDYYDPAQKMVLPAKLFRQFLRRAKRGASPEYLRSIKQHPPRRSQKLRSTRR